MTTPGGARLVAAGILLSRIFGLVRQRVTAHFLGSGVVADALAAAFRIPNLLQNLFGEGSLSASFIPVYAKLLAEGRREDAGRVAGTVLALLALLVSVLVLLGVWFAPALVWLIAPGLDAATQDLTAGLIRISSASSFTIIRQARLRNRLMPSTPNILQGLVASSGPMNIS